MPVYSIYLFFFNFNHPLEFSVKSYQNFQNTYIFFLGKKKRKEKFKDLSVGKDLTEFAKIHMPESLRKKKNTGILKILIEFNRKF
jgi:hypothetical protein